MTDLIMPIETTRVYEATIKVKADSRIEVIHALQEMGVEVEELNPFNCTHQWHRRRVFEIVEDQPVKIEIEWADIPNGLDGDYVSVTPIKVITPEEIERHQIREDIICIACGALSEDGLKVS
jgi:hypothetical protein